MLPILLIKEDENFVIFFAAIRTFLGFPIPEIPAILTHLIPCLFLHFSPPLSLIKKNYLFNKTLKIPTIKLPTEAEATIQKNFLSQEISVFIIPCSLLRIPASVLKFAPFADIYRTLRPVKRYYNGKSHRRLTGGQNKVENNDRLAVQRAAHLRKRHKRDIYGREHQFNGH